MSVNGYNAVGVFVYHRTLGIHAEGADLVAVLGSTVNDLAFIKLVGQMGEHLARQLNANADVHTARFGGNIEIGADRFHPLAAASSDGYDALVGGVFFIKREDLVLAVLVADLVDGRIEEEINLVAKMLVDVFEHDVVYILILLLQQM